MNVTCRKSNGFKKKGPIWDANFCVNIESYCNVFCVSWKCFELICKHKCLQVVYHSDDGMVSNSVQTCKYYQLLIKTIICGVSFIISCL